VNRRFRQTLLALRPDLGVINGGFIYFQPAADILCGFVVERARHFARLYRFALPLYERLDFLHLGFADELPVDAGFLRDEPPVAAAKTFLRVVSPYESAARRCADPKVFLAMVGEGARLQNPWTQRAVATTLAFLGERQEASRWLADLEKSRASMEHVPNWVADLRDLRAAVDAGNASIAELLNRWQRETRSRFDIPPARN